MRIPWMPFNLGVFLIIFGGLLFGSLAEITNYNPLQSFALTILIFGIWLGVASVIITPSTKYAANRRLVLAWGGLLAAFGLLFFVGVTSGPALPIVFSILIVLAGIGVLGYSLVRAAETQNSNRPSPTGTTNL